MKIELEIDDDFIDKYGHEIMVKYLETHFSLFEVAQEIEEIFNKGETNSEWFLLHEDTDEYLKVQKDDIDDEYIDRVKWRRNKLRNLKNTQVH